MPRNHWLLLVFTLGVNYGAHMIGWRHWLAGLILVAALPARAEVSSLQDSPYRAILERNAFNLKPLPTNAAAGAISNAPPLNFKVQLSGITVGPQGKYAWLVVPPVPNRNTNTLFWKVKEGEVQEGVEVLEINESARTVKIRSAGNSAVLDLLKDAPPTVGPAAAPVAAGQPVANPAVRGAGGATPRVPGPPGATPGMGATGVVNPSGVSAPSVQRMGTSAVNPSMPATSLGSPNVNAAGNVLNTIPSRQIRGGPDPVPVDRDPVQQWIEMKRAEEAARAVNVPYPPVPPPPIPGLAE